MRRPAIDARQAAEDLATHLAGAGWTRKFPAEWTDDERARFERVSEAARGTHPDPMARAEWDGWLEWMMHEPVQIETDEHGHWIRMSHNGVVFSDDGPKGRPSPPEVLTE